VRWLATRGSLFRLTEAVPSVGRTRRGAHCGQSTIAILQSLDSWVQGRSQWETTPLIA
jgi:hypothetical protein